MSKTTKALKKRAATTQSAVGRTTDAYLSGQITTLAMRSRLKVSYESTGRTACHVAGIRGNSVD
jgi:hypothetical protein